MTKFHVILFLFFIGINFSVAQKYELGLNFGGGNYVGDVGREYYFYPNKPGAGLVFKRTINPWFSVRLNLNYFMIDANDSEAESLGRQIRNLSVEGNLINFSVGMEYNFVPRNPFIPRKTLNRITPFMFVGVGIGNYWGDLLRYKNDDSNKIALRYNYTGTNLNIPMILGFKYRAGRHFIISLESGAYYYFSDNLDGTGAYYRNMYKKNSKLVPTTNLNSNDWYTFTSIGLIYTFGDLNCYFNL